MANFCRSLAKVKSRGSERRSDSPRHSVALQSPRVWKQSTSIFNKKKVQVITSCDLFRTGVSKIPKAFMMIKNIDVLGLNPPKSLQLTIDYWAFQEIQLLENPIPISCHEKSGSLLLLLYFPNMVNWISSKLLGVFLTTWPQDFLKLFRLKEKN